jgi:tRNA threonylcarbamoyladenosine biosynthesis protein TsaB
MGRGVSGPLMLAVESATARVGCALGTVDGVMASVHSARGRRHAESLTPQIQFVVEQAGMAVRDIEMIGVDIGPGLYTGLRVGITTGRAMAHTLGVPMVAVTSLDAIAHACFRGDELAVAIDARRGEVFHSIYTSSGDGELTGTTPAVAPPDVLIEALSARGVSHVVGDGALAYEPLFSQHGISVGGVDSAHPLPDAVLQLALSRVESAVAPTEIEPLYLRRPDAVAKWEGAAS